MWRLGHPSGPLDFPPWDFWQGNNRFDDTSGGFRTLYCAQEPLTCLREKLHPLRPKASAEHARVFSDPARMPPGTVGAEMRRNNVLAPARIVLLRGELIDLEDLSVRRDLEHRHAALLETHGIAHLDISQLRSDQRFVTQTIARGLFRQGASGILYRSNIDSERCFALFETQAYLEPDGEAVPLTDPIPELLQICDEFNLALL